MGAGAGGWCTWWRQVAGAGAGAAGAGAGAVSWLRTWWRQVAGAGCRAPVCCVLETGCAGAGAGLLVLVLVPGAGAGAGAVAGCARGGDWCCVLVPGAGAGAGVPVRCWCCAGADAGGVACIYVGTLFAQIARLWDSYFK